MSIGFFSMIAIAVALGLDLFAKSACHGALLSIIHKGRLIKGIFFFAVYQVFLLTAGYAIAVWMQHRHFSDEGDTINALLCIIIFCSMAVRMLRIAVKNEDMVEHRQDEDYMKKIFASLCLQVGFYTFLTGIGLGLVRVTDELLLGILVLFGAIGIIAGLECGYHYGYRLKTKAYALGGMLLLVTMAVLAASTLL